MIKLPKICEKTGKPKLSYSQINAWENYKQDYIKQYFMGIKLPSSPYAEFGTNIGVARETGDYSMFDIETREILEQIPRVDGTLYEREILLDMGDFVVQGFIDEFVPHTTNVVELVPESLYKVTPSYIIIDNKTGGKGKDSEYRSKDYLQTVIYRMALEQDGIVVSDTQVRFFLRSGSHFKPPMKLSGEVFIIPIDYNAERVEYAKAKLRRIASEISEMYSAYNRLNT